jgi:transposase InsO family protein
LSLGLLDFDFIDHMRMNSDIQDYVNACITCQMTGKSSLRQHTIGGSLTASNPFEFIAMDILAMPESWAGNKYVLVVMDYYSRYAIVEPISDKTAETIARALLNRIFLVYGTPNKLLSDNGGEFKNKLLTELCNQLQVQRVFTTPYNPQCDGMVERFNRTLTRLLACYVGKNQRDWDRQIQHIVFAYNTANRISTFPYRVWKTKSKSNI